MIFPSKVFTDEHTQELYITFTFKKSITISGTILFPYIHLIAKLCCDGLKMTKLDFVHLWSALLAFNQSQTFCSSMLVTLSSDKSN